MIRKLLKKLGWKDDSRKSENYTEKTTHENSSQPVNESEETTKVSPSADITTYESSSQSEDINGAFRKVTSQPTDTNNDPKTSDWKTDNVNKRKINVFVSSTFKDMQAERDELVKRIFPRLRKLCEERGITWGEVDLRWGITDEQKAEGKVLPICLAEIEHCRPYFIGILGERYGWVDDEILQAVVEQYEWLNEYKGKSVTELEILHGVLRNPEMADHAFFYFRDPSYLNSIAENELTDYIEVPTVEDIQKYGLKEAEIRAEEKKKKLVELKESIKNSGFPVKENYSNPKTLGELVFQDLKDVINGLYPEGEKLDPLEKSRFEHETFAESRFNIYIENKEYFDTLDAHIRGNGLPLVVVGDSGSGKSALLANWAKRFNENGFDKPFLLVHYIGATPDSMDWASMLRRIMGEMKIHFSIHHDIPDKPDELKIAFANWLNMVAEQGKMVLVIDALNQLVDLDGALELFWLPEIIPSDIRLIVSLLPSKSLDELNKRNWLTLEVKPLDFQERRKLIVDYLKQYSRNLSMQMVDHIASHNQTSNPFYLRALLEEMRLYGDHFTLLQKVNHYLAAPTVEDLYDKILERYEEDYDRDRKNLVRDTFSYLVASRNGLSEIELCEMLSYNDEPLPRALWSPLYLAAEKSLVNISGLLNFSHDYFRTAVKERYLKTENDEQYYHLFLADYFEKRQLNKRKVEELPWQLSKVSKGESWNRLVEMLTDSSFFNMAWDLNEFDVKGYWVLIEDNSEISMLKSYKPLIESPSRYDVTFVFRVSGLLCDAGHLSGAFSLNSYLIESSQKTVEFDLLQASLCSQAFILHYRGNLGDAIKLYAEQERICRKLGYINGLQACLINQAVARRSRGELDIAMKLYKEQEKICIELGNKVSLQFSMGNQANILAERGSLDEAMKLYKKQERICVELGNKEGLQICLGNQANILSLWGKLNSAMQLLKKQEQICRELGYKVGLQICLGNQANIFSSWGDLDSAMKLYKEKERICRELGHKEGLAEAIFGKALIFSYLGHLDGAMNLFKEQERICIELENKIGLQHSLNGQARILQSKGKIDSAMKLLKETERICRELGYKEGIAGSMGNQACILYSIGNLDRAMQLYKEEEKIYRELGIKEGLAQNLISQALCLNALNKSQDSLQISKQAFKIANDHGYISLAKQIESIMNDIQYRTN